MDSALAWVGHLVEWIGQFIPRWTIIPTFQGGVKFIRGHKVVPLGPGFHPYWPLTTLIRTYPTARQANDLRPQIIVTSDDKTVIVGGMIVYEIVDIEKILANTWDPDDTIRDIALSVIHERCSAYSWEGLKEAAGDQRKLQRSLLADVQTQLTDYGVKVIKVTLTDMAPAHVVRWVGNAPLEQGVG